MLIKWKVSLAYLKMVKIHFYKGVDRIGEGKEEMIKERSVLGWGKNVAGWDDVKIESVERFVQTWRTEDIMAEWQERKEGAG